MYAERIELIKQIESIRKRPLLTYITSIRPNLGANMAGDVISPIIEQIQKIPDDKNEVDFLIVSNGGDPITSLRIMSLLRERFKKVAVLLPYVAYSAATVLALGADEIVMHPFSNLGPVDPQLTVTHNNERGVQERIQFSSEDLSNYIDFIKSDVGVTDQEYLVNAVQPLLKDVGTLSIGRAKRGQQLSLTLSEKMLAEHIKDVNKAKSIAKALNSSYYHHGYAVSRSEAKKIGLPVTIPPANLEDLLWKLWKDYSSEMKCDSPFDILKEVMDDPDSRRKINNVQVLDLPANTPPEVAKNLIIQAAKSIPLTTRSTIDKKALIASVESSNNSKAFYNDICLLYWRNADMSLGFNTSIIGTGWIDYIS